MPPRRSPAPANPTPPPGPPLREVPGGYDLRPLPIRVPPRPGESIVSWLRRASWRYDVTVRELLRGAGTQRPIHSTTRAVTRLRNNHTLLQQLGLDDADIQQLCASTPLELATRGYTRTLRRTRPVPARWSRYCPACLAEPDPSWDADWQNPLMLACLRHHVLLADSCPNCRQRPLASPVWMSRPTELWACPTQLPGRHPSTRGRVVRPWCDANLRTAPAQPVDDDAYAAQELLIAWAYDPTGLTTACDVTITHAIGFHAFVELVDAYYEGDAHHLLDLARDPAATLAGYRFAARVLTSTRLDDAAELASQVLRYDGPHAPIHPPSRLAAHPHNPLLAALQLHGLRDQQSPTDQLTFQMSHRLGRYPLDPDLVSSGRLRLPEHRTIGSRPVSDPAWIPQTLWVDALPKELSSSCPPLHRACLAMALAQIGTADTWTEIANHLGLPPTLANSIGSVLASWDRAGTWPAIHHHLDQLLQTLRTEPPPINYPRRRLLACDLDLLDRALAASADIHPSPLPAPQLRRVFWEAFTGGDIAYTADQYTIDPDSPAYTTYRADGLDSLDRDRPRLQASHQQIQRLTGENLGPLTWTPRRRRTHPTETDGTHILVDHEPHREWPGYSPF